MRDSISCNRPSQSIETWSRREDIISSFESAWQRGEQASVAEYLTGSAGGNLVLLRELVHIDLEYRLKAGEEVRVENYFAHWPALTADRDAAVDLIVAEFQLRAAREADLSCEEYLQRFPNFAGTLAPRLGDEREQPRSAQTEQLNCPHCRAEIAAGESAVGTAIVCPACGSSFQITLGRLSHLRETPPKLGKFELLEPVGRGAFGTVYRARDTQLQRTVAIKIPRRGCFHFNEDQDRFVREARAAAQLHHPGIVSVFDVGRCDGFPYIVAEFIDGVTLAAAMCERRFTNREIAEICREIAAALDHAHAAGVVHRDLKPSNIMLAGGIEGRPLVMDFGLARRDAGEVTMTLEGALLGTPAYMAPEQAAGDAHEADARADVYSLGVVLFELLTGQLPFRGNPRMLLHQVIHDEPPSPRKFDGHIPRDLETICLKCLSKSPSQRYQSCRALGDDLGRWLRSEPVLARPVTRVGRAVRWIRRNPLIAALFGAVAAALMTGTGVSTHFAWQSRQNEAVAKQNEAIAIGNEARAKDAAELAARNEAEAQRHAMAADKQRRLAAQQALHATEVANFLGYLFKGAHPLEFAGTPGGGENAAQDTAHTILQRGAKLAAERNYPPSVRAVILDAVGDIQRSLGNDEAAEPMLVESLKLREIALAADDPDYAVSLFHLGRLYCDRGEFHKAEPLLQKALGICSGRFGPDDLRVAEIELPLAWLRVSQAKNEEAEKLCRHALDVRQRKLADASPDVAAARLDLAAVLFTRGQVLEGTSLGTQAVRNLPGGDQFLAAVIVYMRARTARSQRDFALSERLYREALDEARRFLGERHFLVGMLEGDFAHMYLEKGDDERYEQTIRPVLDRARRSPLAGHPEMIKAMLTLSNHLRSRGEVAEAEQLCREVLDYCQRRNEPPNRAALEGLMALLRQQGRDAEAEVLLRTEPK